MSKNSLYQDLFISENEKDVENAYRAHFAKIFGAGYLSSLYKTDGVLNHPDIHAILEFKNDIDMRTRSGIAQALIQVIYYLHMFEDNGAVIPKVTFASMFKKETYFNTLKNQKIQKLHSIGNTVGSVMPKIN